MSAGLGSAQFKYFSPPPRARRVLRHHDARIVAMHLQGKDTQEIADALGFSRSAISHRLSHELGFPFPKAADRDAEVLRLHHANVPPQRIAYELGVSTSAIYYRLRANGIHPNRDFVGSKPYIAQILRLWEEGLTPREIGAKLNFDTGTIRMRLKEAGIDSRQRTRRPNAKHDQLIKYLYVDRQWNMLAIARRLGVNHQVIRLSLKEQGIPLRTLAESLALSAKVGDKYDKQILELYAKPGSSVAQVARILKCSPDTVHKRLAANNVPVRKWEGRRAHLDPQILEMYQAGYTQAQIGRLLNMSRNSVGDRLVKMAERGLVVIERRPPTPRLTHQQVAQTIYLYTEKGLTVREVADMLGVTPNAVHYRLTRAGVTLRPHRGETTEERKARLQKRAA